MLQIEFICLQLHISFEIYICTFFICAYFCGSNFKYIILPFGPCSSIYVAPYNFDGARASTERTALMEWAVSAVLLSAVVESAVAERKMARPVSQPRAFLAPGHLYPIRPGID